MCWDAVLQACTKNPLSTHQRYYLKCDNNQHPTMSFDFIVSDKALEGANQTPHTIKPVYSYKNEVSLFILALIYGCSPMKL